jgi:hypothetical protein
MMLVDAFALSGGLTMFRALRAWTGHAAGPEWMTPSSHQSPSPSRPAPYCTTLSPVPRWQRWQRDGHRPCVHDQRCLHIFVGSCYQHCHQIARRCTRILVLRLRHDKGNCSASPVRCTTICHCQRALLTASTTPLELQTVEHALSSQIGQVAYSAAARHANAIETVRTESAAQTVPVAEHGWSEL